MATTNLNGKTAAELRAVIASGEATKAEVLEYLVGKGENIRKPSRILRDELAGATPTPKPAATPTPKPAATPTPKPAALAVALEALRAATAAVEALLAAETAPAKPTPPPAAKPTPPPAAIVDEDEDEDDETITEADAREHVAGLTVKELREMLDSEDLPTTGKREVLVERVIAFLCPPPVQATENKPKAKTKAERVTLDGAVSALRDTVEF
jgi:hypothetical protein